MGLKTAIPGKKESGPHFSTQPGNVIVQFLNPKPRQRYEKPGDFPGSVLLYFFVKFFNFLFHQPLRFFQCL